MNVVVTTEGHFYRTPDGQVWSSGPMVYAYWKRYLGQFAEVRVVSRVRDVARIEANYLRADGDRVQFLGLPEYVGPVQYALKRSKIQKIAREAAVMPSAILLRVGCSETATEVERATRSIGKPFGVEVITDPYQVLAPGALKHPLRPYFRRKFMHDLQRQCRDACASAYVTERSLQRRYPAGGHGFTTNVSDVLLDDSAFVEHARRFPTALSSAHIVSIGSMAQIYKGFDVLIDAVHRSVGAGLDLSLTLVGDGRHRTELESEVHDRGLTNRVTFTGQLSTGEAVRRHLDSADIFVLASRTEGLPRVVIEAMARGLPCIGTNVGGIPELLEPEDLVPSESASLLAERIREFCADPRRMSSKAERNLLRSRDYEQSVLAGKRNEFLAELREQTQQWYSRSGSSRSRAVRSGHTIPGSSRLSTLASRGGK